MMTTQQIENEDFERNANQADRFEGFCRGDRNTQADIDAEHLAYNEAQA